MNKRDSNASVEAIHRFSENDSPPFALDDHFSSLNDQQDNKYRETFDEISISMLSQPPAKEMEIDSRCLQLKVTTCSKDYSLLPNYPQHSSQSTPPDLIESTTTDGTSCCSVFSAPKSDMKKSINPTTKIAPLLSISRPASIQSSIVTTSSLTSVPLEPRLPGEDFHPVLDGSFQTNLASSNDPHMIIRQPNKISSFIGFSELMEAADDSNIELEQSRPATLMLDHGSSEKLQPLLENQEVESGALISAAPRYQPVSTMAASTRIGKVRKWWHNMPLFDSGSNNVNLEFKRHLLSTISGESSKNDASGNPHITRLLSSGNFQHQYINSSLKRASESVQTQIESEDSFEVSLLLQENALLTVDDVMEVISNTDLLHLWCSPIKTVIVTSSSNGDSSFATNLDENQINVECGLHGSSTTRDDVCGIREYEAEWIEATTSSLESPSSSGRFILNVGHSALQSLGCTSYGRITIFIERRHGRIGLTIGPFHGGIHASHSISVSEDPNSNCRRIRIVDRVRLTRDNIQEGFLSGGILGCAMGSCLSHFFFPSVDECVDQVTLSMARLRLLLENE